MEEVLGSDAADDVDENWAPERERELRRSVGPMAWAVLADLCLDARHEEGGVVVAVASARQLAANVGIGKDTAARALRRLAAARVLRRRPQATGAGRFGCCTYELRDVIVAVAPGLYGRNLSELSTVRRTLADPEAVPLLRVAGAHDRPYATATTIAREQAIARCVESQVSRLGAPKVSRDAADAAVDRAETALGRPLTVGQHGAVDEILTSGRGVELVVGVAGSGKTTALAAARDGFEAAGYELVDTSTSGQAARWAAKPASSPAAPWPRSIGASNTTHCA